LLDDGRIRIREAKEPEDCLVAKLFLKKKVNLFMCNGACYEIVGQHYKGILRIADVKFVVT
jgi:hypothetical protein